MIEKNLKHFFHPEYQLHVQLNQDQQSMTFDLHIFNIAMCQKNYYSTTISYDNLEQQAQFLFASVNQLFKACFSSSNNLRNIHVKGNTIYIFYHIGTHRQKENNQKNIMKKKQLELDREQGYFKIVLEEKEIARNIKIKGWIHNFKNQLIKIKDNQKCSCMKKVQMLKCMVVVEELRKKKKWDYLIYKTKQISHDSYSECRKVTIPFSISRINQWDKQIFYLLVRSGQKFPILKQLNFKSSLIGDKGIRYLIRLDCPQVSDLSLTSCNISDEGVKYLSSAKLPKLQYLSLNRNKITGIGLKHLTQCKFPQLVYLNLHKNQYTAEGAKHLLKSNFPKLKQLIIGHNLIYKTVKNQYHNFQIFVELQRSLQKKYPKAYISIRD